MRSVGAFGGRGCGHAPLCDAWFDTVLANGRGEQVEAALEAALVELPLGAFLRLARPTPRADRRGGAERPPSAAS